MRRLCNARPVPVPYPFETFAIARKPGMKELMRTGNTGTGQA